MSRRFLAVVNRAAGGGRCGKLVDEALGRLAAGGIELELAETTRPGHASEIARAAYARGQRNFLAVGGDGTSYEIINGLFPQAQAGERPTLAFLPLGTGNSFLRDFSERGLEHATQALLTGQRHACDVLRLTHREGVLHYINLLSMGFAADVAAVRIRRFKNMGELGYLLALFVCLARLD
ncbi:MAG TPA: acylglycerol kinase family protein, partial [Terriglobales bacterium]|nr:acylglycerol kinase family protein [Terriglobales bacterium]